MNNFNYIYTLERKRNDNLAILKSNIKSKADKGIRSPVAWAMIDKYAIHCDAMRVWSAVLKVL